ncbi:MAG: hypothetical protein HOM63_08945 [Kordiimonadaceae bacterium]|jgi:hypothetical protein|nr:hypothetical protein [Kordiimonadaceae bacterium]
MRVALINNMNNCFFAIARHLRDRGIDAHLFVQKDIPEHFHPSADTFDDSYKNYTHYYEWSGIDDLKETYIDTIRKDMEGYDFLIGCGDVPAFMRMAGLKLDLFIPYGADMFYLPFFQFTHPKRILKILKLMKYQKQGINDTDALWFEPSHNLEFYSKKIGYDRKIISSTIPIIYHKKDVDLTTATQSEKKLIHQFKNIRENNEIVIFHHSRHCWRDTREFISLKANNLLFEGLREFIDEYDDIKVKVITFEYGPDVDDSKTLIEKLGLEKNVSWFPKISRKILLQGIQLSDIGVAELYHSFLTYGAIGEFMACEVPVFAKRDDHLYNDQYPDLYPIYHADTVSEIKEALIEYIKNKSVSHKNSVGHKGYLWFQKHMIDTPVNKLIQLIEHKNKDK